MEVHVVLHLDGSKITGVERKLSTLIQKVEVMSDALQSKLDNLRKEVAESRTVVQSAVVLINGIKQMVADAVEKAKSDGVPAEALAALDEFAASLDSDQHALSQAMAENTGTTDTGTGAGEGDPAA